MADSTAVSMGGLAGAERRRAAAGGWWLAVLLGSLTALAPLSIELYLPAFPRLAQNFQTSESDIQVTLTACLAGLAFGQLLAGPCADAWGRRRPLLVGLALFAGASAGAALAPSVTALTACRFVQGLAGAAGVAIARAVARDLHSGVELARYFSLLQLVYGIAPILGPALGGQLLRVLPWPGLFAVLTGYALVLLIATGCGLRETLPPASRHPATLASTVRVLGRLWADKRFVGYTLITGCSFAAMFCYLSGSPFLFQNIYHLAPQQVGLVFALNAVGIMALGQSNRVLLRRFPPRRLLAVGLCLAGFGGIELLITTLVGLGLPAVLPGFFAVVASIGLVLPNTTALALAGHPGQAGNASALLGLPQYLFGAAFAPLVGIMGTGLGTGMSTASAVPMAGLISGLTLTALALFALLTKNVPEPPPES